MWYELQGATVQTSVKLLCTAKYSDDPCGYFADCAIPGDELVVTLVHNLRGIRGNFPVSVSPTIVVGPAADGTVSAPGAEPPRPPAIPTVHHDPRLRRQLLVAKDDNPPTLRPPAEVIYATTTYSTAIAGIGFGSLAVAQYSMSTQCHIYWHFVPDTTSAYVTKMVLIVGGQVMATSLSEQDPMLVWNRNETTPVDVTVTVLADPTIPIGDFINGTLHFQAKGSCGSSVKALDVAYTRPAPGPVVLWYPNIDASDAGLQGNIGATRLTAVDFEGSVTPDSQDAPPTTTQVVLLSPSVSAGTAISVTEWSQGPGKCNMEKPGDLPAYVFRSATTRNGTKKVCDPKPCEGAPCGCITGCALTDDMVALELTADTPAAHLNASVQLGASWSASVWNE